MRFSWVTSGWALCLISQAVSLDSRVESESWCIAVLVAGFQLLRLFFVSFPRPFFLPFLALTGRSVSPLCPLSALQLCFVKCCCGFPSSSVCSQEALPPRGAGPLVACLPSVALFCVP